MDIALLSKKYLVRRLDVNDVDIVYNMSCKNEIFYKYHPPFVTKQSMKRIKTFYAKLIYRLKKAR